MAPPASLVAASFGLRIVTTTSKGATDSGQTMPASSWQRSTTAAMVRSIPMP